MNVSKMSLRSMNDIVMFNYRTLTCLIILVSPVLAADVLLSSLIGENGKNHITVCLDNSTECEGVLWKPQWVITRTGCLANITKNQIGVIRGGDRGTCFEYDTELGKQGERVRRVQVALKHPRPEYNLTLLQLGHPFPEVERLVDTRTAETLLQQFEPWLENTIRNNEPDKTYVLRYPRRFGIGVFESPVKTFVSLVVVPSALFIIFFSVITCFTRPRSKVSVRQYEKI